MHELSTAKSFDGIEDVMTVKSTCLRLDIGKIEAMEVTEQFEVEGQN